MNTPHNYSQDSEVLFIKEISKHADNRYFVDVGANDGCFSRVLGQLSWRGVVIEPDPHFRELLERLARKINGIYLPYAITSTDGAGKLYLAEDSSGNRTPEFNSLRALSNDERIVHSKSMDVSCRSIDSLIAEGLVEAKAGFVKVDTEGNDLDVLYGAKKISAEILMVEFSGSRVYPSRRSASALELIEVVEGNYRLGNYLIFSRWLNSAAPVYIGKPIPIEEEAAWGNIIFFNDKIRSASEDAISGLLADSTRSFVAFMHQQEKSARDKEAVIQELQREKPEAAGDLQEIRQRVPESTGVSEKKDIAIYELSCLVAQQGRELDRLQESLRDKDGLTKALEEHSRSLEAKEQVIQEQRRALQAYRAAFVILGPLIRPLTIGLAKFRRLVGPRLGILYQHPPRAIRFLDEHQEPLGLRNPPKISIITPAFKQAEYIERTLKSVLDQQYPNLEYFVQDGGSQDGTTDILRQYENQLLGWESKPDNGQSYAINLGFARTSGEIMAWLNSDDLLLPGTLAHVARFFDEHPEVDVVYGNRILIDENDREVGRWVLPKHDDEVLSWADYVPQETLFWRRRIWDKVGSRVDESFRFAMDWDLLVRFREAGARFHRLPRFLGAFRVHAQQKTSAVISDIGHGEMARIRRRVLGRDVACEEIRKTILPYLMRHVVTDLGYRIRKKLGYSL